MINKRFIQRKEEEEEKATERDETEPSVKTRRESGKLENMKSLNKERNYLLKNISRVFLSQTCLITIAILNYSKQIYANIKKRLNEFFIKYAYNVFGY